MIRVLSVLIGSLFRPRPLGPLEESCVHMRVWLTDLDINLHMNNARYLALMDLGRLDLAGRQGMLRFGFRHSWRAMVGSINIRYRRSLQPFQRFLLRTRMLCWDDKWFYIEQRFERDGQTWAIGLVKALVRDARGNLSPADALLAMGHDPTSPAMPAAVDAWRKSEAMLARG